VRRCRLVRSHEGLPGRALGAMANWCAAVLTAVIACSLIAPYAGVAAASPWSAPSSPATRMLAADSPGPLPKLEARAARLSRQYRGQIAQLTEAAATAHAAEDHALRLRRSAARAHRQVARLAAEGYMGGWADPGLELLTDGDPQRVLDRTATVDFLARQRSMLADRLQKLATAADRAQRDARAKVARFSKLIGTLLSQRRKVEQLIARFRPQSPTIGGDRITARMRQVRDTIDRRFGPFPAIGCYRPGSDGEHPLGRACDFMLSSGGLMPSAPWVQRGYQLAAWAQANASRLGIMYIIYRQRIWDIRMASSGWVPMADRGGITANHFDHVHISVF
jgi:hypothetical protein